jgi:hypothetical protein
MTHAKHTTMVDVTDRGENIRLYSLVGEEGNQLPDIHYIPKIALGIRAAEYDLDPEDPRVLEMILRIHHHSDTGKPRIEREDGRPPLYTMETVAAARDFIGDRIEEVRVDRKAPAIETGARMLAGAIENRVATEALVQARSMLLKFVDKRLVEPVQHYRDQMREEVAREVVLTPADRMLRQFDIDRRRVNSPPSRTPKR